MKIDAQKLTDSGISALVGMQDFTFDPYASRRKMVENDDGTLTLSVSTRTGSGRDMPGPITVPAHLAEEVKECMYSCGEAVIGKAKMTDDRLVMQLVFQSALWTDMRGNWFDYETLEPVDMYGAPLKAAA